MKDMTPDNVAAWLQTYLGTLKVESRLTRSVLDAVPADRADYRPDPVSKSALELVKHIASADNRFVEAVITGTFNPAAAVPADAETPAQIASWYAVQYAKNFEELTRATPEQLLAVLDFRGMFRQPAFAFLMMGLHHTVHHRGQLSSYLRSMGTTVPAIYGESYDTAAAKKAAGA